MSTDSFDEIEERLKAGHCGSLAHTAAKAALEVKLAKETIKQQKKMVKATRILMVFTGVLVIVTGAYTYVTYNTYQGAKDQTQAVNNLTSSIKEDLTKAINDAAMHERTILRDMVPKKKPSSRQHNAVTGRR